MRSNKKQDPSKMFRVILHIAMGLIYLIVGVLVIVRQWFLIELQPLAAWSMGILIIIYGAFRCYRGYIMYLDDE